MSDDKLNLFFKIGKQYNSAPDWLRSEAIECKSFEYSCPKCGTEHPETDEFGYIVDDENWPIVHNYHSYGNDMGHGYNWVEYHKCENCKIIYVYDNGT